MRRWKRRRYETPHNFVIHYNELLFVLHAGPEETPTDKYYMFYNKNMDKYIGTRKACNEEPIAGIDTLAWKYITRLYTGESSVTTFDVFVMDSEEQALVM